jgi:hypothetical protein
MNALKVELLHIGILSGLACESTKIQEPGSTGQLDESLITLSVLNCGIFVKQILDLANEPNSTRDLERRYRTFHPSLRFLY